ncbi:MAG: hypothetical protein ACRDRR_18730 [Pseudonocardiaceae bacterium]
MIWLDGLRCPTSLTCSSVRIGRLRRIPAEAITAYTARLIAEQHAAA